jgi:hypothetical protein
LHLYLLIALYFCTVCIELKGLRGNFIPCLFVLCTVWPSLFFDRSQEKCARRSRVIDSPPAIIHLIPSKKFQLKKTLSIRGPQPQPCHLMCPSTPFFCKHYMLSCSRSRVSWKFAVAHANRVQSVVCTLSSSIDHADKQIAPRTRRPLYFDARALSFNVPLFPLLSSFLTSNKNLFKLNFKNFHQ